MRLKVFSNAGLTDSALARLRKALTEMGGHELVLPGNFAGSNLVEGPSDPGLLSADVAFGQPNVSDLLVAPKLKFVQLTSAGWARYERQDLLTALKNRGAAMCNASAVYMEPCAEHVLAFMMAAARQLAPAWAGDTHSPARRWEQKPIRQKSFLLTGQSVLLVGYGTIAQRITELLAPFKMKIKAVRRNVRGNESVRTYPIIAIEELLPDADHVINVLPGTPQTANFFDARKLGLIRPTALFYNIGRGTTVDQVALMEALTAGKLAAAYLDVTDPEPLPANHPLWNTPNCVITPHTAGGYDAEFEAQVDHFLNNLKRFTGGTPLVDQVA